MAAPYDYVQIVTDDDWGLVGIIPNNGTETPNGNPFISINTDDRVKRIPSNQNDSVPTITSLPKATVVNRRRPNTNNIAKKVEVPPITRAESTISLYGHTLNPNILNGMGALESSLNPSIHGRSQHRMHESDLVLFGEISNLAGPCNRDNILVGYC